MQNSIDEILALIKQTPSGQVHGRVAELLHTLFNVSLLSVDAKFFFAERKSFDHQIIRLKRSNRPRKYCFAEDSQKEIKQVIR